MFQRKLERRLPALPEAGPRSWTGTNKAKQIKIRRQTDGSRGHPAATLRGSLGRALTLHVYFGKNWQGRKIKVYVAIFHSRKPTDLCKAEK